MRKTMTPGEGARLAQDERQFNAARGPGVVAGSVTDSQGNVLLYNKQGGIINRLEGAGKPSSTYEKARLAEKNMARDITQAISELELATKDGGLIDASTGSGAGALVDAGARFFGGSTSGARAASRLAPIADMVLKLVPRFEGPQSDKDTESYRRASGDLANSNLPNEERKAAATEILRIMKNRRGQFEGVAPAGRPILGLPNKTAQPVSQSNGELSGRPTLAEIFGAP